MSSFHNEAAPCSRPLAFQLLAHIPDTPPLAALTSFAVPAARVSFISGLNEAEILRPSTTR